MDCHLLKKIVVFFFSLGMTTLLSINTRHSTRIRQTLKWIKQTHVSEVLETRMRSCGHLSSKVWLIFQKKDFLGFFSVGMIKYLNQSNLREKGPYCAPQSSYSIIMAGAGSSSSHSFSVSKQEETEREKEQKVRLAIPPKAHSWWPTFCW